MSYCNYWLLTGAVFLSGTASLLAQSASGTPPMAGQPIAFPTLAEVEKVVAEYLQRLTNREEDDLLSRGDVAPLYDQLKAIGWVVADEAEIQKRLLNDSDWLVRTLRTKSGTRFMRDMSSFPGGYDRLDRMQHQRYGKRELKGLIETPGGSELIKYLTTTKQGRNTGRQLSSRYGNDFNAPTDRLYTKSDVLKQLRLSYAAEAARRTQPTSAPVIQP